MMIIGVARALLPAAFDLDLGSWQNPAGSNPKDAPLAVISSCWDRRQH
jgi:hypothetical protein